MLARIRTLVGGRGAGRTQPNFKAPSGSTAIPADDPTPLPHTEPSTAAYPLEHLTPGLRRAAEAIVAMTQAPVAIAAQSVLSVASLAVASRAKVETLGSPAYAASFFVAIALSGERKSAADKLAMGGVDRVVMQIRSDYEAAMAAYKAQVAALGRGEEKPAKPVCPSFLVTEPTVEGAFKAISSGTGFLGWFTDEASSFWGGHSMSKDQRAKTSGIVSKFWDGAFFYRPRATQEGDGYVPPTATTLNLMFQPVLIPETYGDTFLTSQGILARMLPAWPESKMGERFYRRSTAADRSAIAAFQDDIAEALIATLETKTERHLELTEDAHAACVEFHDDVERELARGGWAAEISGFASKAPEHACRLAAIMTLFENRDADTVPAEIMRSAIEMVKYHILQYKYLIVSATNEAEVAHAQSLLDWLRRNLTAGDAFATDRILQTGPVKTRRAKSLDKALTVLIRHHWIAELPAGTVVDGKKRRKAYRLHPKA